MDVVMVNCPICFSARPESHEWWPDGQWVILRCGHVFHRTCIESWWNHYSNRWNTPVCAICRKMSNGLRPVHFNIVEPDAPEPNVVARNPLPLDVGVQNEQRSGIYDIVVGAIVGFIMGVINRFMFG